MNILCINTCFKTSNVELLNDEHKYFAKQQSSLQHSVVLMTQIEEVFEKSKIRSENLNYICVAVGPGSFTGIRIGVAVSKGLSDTTNARIIPIDTLSLIAYNSTISPDYIVVKGISDEYFLGECKDGKVVNKILITKENLLKKLTSNTRLATIDDLGEDFRCVIERVEKLDMNQIALDNVKNAVESIYVEPFYLRLSQAEMQKGENNANS